MVFKPYIIKEFGRTKIGIIGLSDSGNRSFDDFIIKDWRVSLKEHLEAVEKQCDLILILSNLSKAENLELQTFSPTADIVITSRDKAANRPPKFIGPTMFSQSGNRGKYLTALELQWVKHGEWQTQGPSKLEQLNNNLKTTEWYIEEFSKQDNPNNSQPPSSRILRLQAQRDTLKEQIASLKRENTAGKESIANSYNSRIIPIIPRTTPDHIQDIVREITSSINRYNQQRQAKIKAASSPKDMLDDPIAGHDKCSSCHVSQYLFWKNTSHSTSFNTLKVRGQVYNLDCLPCHVTTASITTDSSEQLKETLLLLDSQRQAVGCESCHGPSKAHAESPDTIPVRTTVTKAVCSACHTEEQDSNFDYIDKLHKVRCPAD